MPHTFLTVILDGRDTPPNSGIGYFKVGHDSRAAAQTSVTEETSLYALPVGRGLQSRPYIHGKVANVIPRKLTS